MSSEKVHEILHQKADKTDIVRTEERLISQMDKIVDKTIETLAQKVVQNEGEIVELDKRVSLLERDKIERDEAQERQFTWVHGVLVACIGLAPVAWEVISKFL